VIPAERTKATGITDPGYSDLNVRLGLREADDLLAFFKLAAFLQEFDALETLQDVPLRRDGAGSFKTAMLRHKIGPVFFGKERARYSVT
jgi:hypothetical protein